MLTAQDSDPQTLTGSGDRYFPPNYAKRSAVIAPNAMAATSHPLATQIAVELLKKGGTAVDAAIGANAAIGFLEPTGNGIGGDIFAIIWSAEDQKLYGLNGSGRAPLSLTLEDVIAGIGDEDEIPVRSPYSITVPGAVDGWFELHGKFGKLDMKDILSPAVSYARNGAPVPQYIANLWSFTDSESWRSLPGFAQVFLPEGHAPKKGEIFRNPALANTLEKIGKEGRDAYYKGSIADEIDAFCKSAGCFVTREDLAAHRSEWRDPVGVSFNDFTLWELPPNGQGIAALQMLKILENFDLESMGHNSADYLHHLIEAKKIAYEDRGKYYADPAFADVPVEQLISDDYLLERSKLLNPDKASTSLDPGDPRAGRGGTIYLTVADSDGNMISLIQSNYAGFGSGFVPEKLGFSFQDRGSCFSLEPDHPNAFAPGKRPFHTIIPGFITKDDKPYMAFGVMGGAMQPQGHVQVMLNHILFGMDIQESGDAARFRHEGSTQPFGTFRPMTNGGCIALESGVSAEVVAELKARGHIICEPGWVHYGGYQAVMWDEENQVYWGGTESRVDGQAAGY